ncbi:hypothetical protein F5Y16DRAFT_372063 [Xylariaceae sp. FL0255]|nr:hypothetical protein F5Y16DRAFT_372063 [Xylariaceae sp. FL0255]
MSDDFLDFGSDVHACPGRLFAQDVIKLLLATLLMRYEFQYPEQGQKRPENISDNLIKAQTLLFQS